MAEVMDTGEDGFTAYADAESFQQGMDLLGEFNTIVDRANTELAEALKGCVAAGTYEERLHALHFILRTVSRVAISAGVHAENLFPILNLTTTFCETPSVAWDALAFKMWGELKASKEALDIADARGGGKQDEAPEKKVGGQGRRALRIDFILREAACHDYLIKKGDMQLAAP